MSDTPKTDAAEYTSTEFVGDGNYVVRSSFARQLERRIAELETEKERYRKALLWCERNLSCAGSLGMPRSVARSVGAAIRVSERVLRGEER